MDHIPLCTFGHRALPLHQRYDSLDSQAANGIEHPNTDTNDKHAQQDYQRVIDHLLRRGVHDLLQLALGVPEKLPDRAKLANPKITFLCALCRNFFSSAIAFILSESDATHHFVSV